MRTLTRPRLCEVLEAAGLTFALAMMGIATQGIETYALFWPANAAMAGWFLRRPDRVAGPAWAGVIAGYVAADLLCGRPLGVAAVLLTANLAEVITALVVLWPLDAEGRRLGRPGAVVRLGLACVSAAGAGGLAGAAGFAVWGDPTPLRTGLIWWFSDTASMAAVLPLALSFPSATDQPGPPAWPAGARLRALAGPVGLLVLMALVGVATRGIGVTGFLALPLIWFAMNAGMFATAVMSFLVSIWIFLALGLGYYSYLQGPYVVDMAQVTLPIRLAIALIALSAILVASIMAARRQAERRLADSESRLALAFQGTNDGVWDLDVPTGHLSIQDPNSAPGRPAARLVEEWIETIHPDDRGKVSVALEDHLAGRSPACVVEHRWPGRDGGWVWVLTRGRIVEHDQAGRPLRVVGSFMDVSARKALEQQIEYMANHDALTGLANRRALDTALQLRVAAHRLRSSRTVLLLIDLDGFKAVNDGHGHPAGDTVLSVLGVRLAECVPQGAVVARIGGDEFAVIGEGLDADQVAALAVDIRDAVAIPVPIDAGQVTVGASIGWAFLPDDADDDRGLYAVADARLYAEKQRARLLTRSG